MVAPTERAYLLNPVAGTLEPARDLRMRGENVLQSALQRRCSGCELTAVAMLFTANRHITRNLIENALQLFFTDLIGCQRRARCNHAAADINPYRRWNDGVLCRNDGPHCCTYARMYIGHSRHVMVDDGKLRQIYELLARTRLDVVGVDLDGYEAPLDRLLDGHGFTRVRLAEGAVNAMGGRGDRIRTCDILLPKQALYRAELHPEPGTAAMAAGYDPFYLSGRTMHRKHDSHVAPHYRDRCYRVYIRSSHRRTEIFRNAHADGGRVRCSLS
jgi:hypothetical protein